MMLNTAADDALVMSVNMIWLQKRCYRTLYEII